MKTVSQLDAAGYFIGPTISDESPRQPGVFLIPAGAVDSLPPNIPQGQRALWNGAWMLEPIPMPPPPAAPPPPEPLTDAQALLKIDADADRIISDAVGSRTTEYEMAEAGAAAYQAAGYTGTVPPSVQIWATVESQTAQWAADDILAQASAWRGASLVIRQARLIAKRDVRAGQTDTALATWAGFVASMRAALGLQQ
jgi:hypothetical protein